jgi:Bacterial Ig-like domain
VKPILRSLSLIPALAAASCSSSSSGSKSGEAAPGLTFSYPLDGQVDVPVQARLIFQFAAPVEAAALGEPCALDGDSVLGGLCVIGAEGVVPVATEILGEDGTIVSVSSTELMPGASYRVFVRPGLQPAASNLLADQPMLTFRTRHVDSRSGAPELLSVSGEDPRAFVAGGPPLRRPILDHTTLRLVFSEALDERTLIPAGADANVKLRRTDGASPEVAATILLQHQHLVVDPLERLAEGGAYQLVINELPTNRLVDRGGTAVPTTILSFTPRASQTYPQLVEIDYPGTSTGPGEALSQMTGAPYNSVVKRSALIGTSSLGVLPGTLRVELGDPGAFGGPIPFVMPKGQRLAASELALKLAGIIDMGYQTGSLYFDLVSDANGWVSRNPYRPADQVPDDKAAPLMVELYFDAALVADDPTGNAMATQTHLNIHLTGEATSSDGQLVMEAAGAIEVELLGVSRSTADISLRVRTGAVEMAPLQVAPKIVAASPARGDTNVPLDVRPQILLSSAIDLGQVLAAGQVSLTSAAGPALVTLRASGGALVVTPRTPLIAGTTYTLTVGTLVDVAGKTAALSPDDATAGTGLVTFTTAGIPGGAAVPPLLVAVVPGAPCALAGATGMLPGHCVGDGNGGDPSYQPFTLPADRPVEARFSQAMSAPTMQVGAACNQGAIRLEEVNGTTCVATVTGELLRSMNGFRLQPLSPLKVGARYRFSMIAGDNASCAATGELCGANGRPFNSDPLNGVEGAGGNAVVLYFTAGEPTRKTGTTSINLATAMVADRNANGTIDAGERREQGSELAVDVASTGGIVSAASVTGPGPDCRPELAGFQACLGMTADLPVTVLPSVASCPIDLTGAPATGAGPCVPVRISAQDIQTTSLTLSATAEVLGIGIDLSNVQTRMMHIRLLERNAEGAVGYIMSGDDGKPVFVVAAQTLMDAPDLSILAGVVSHDVNSKPVNLVLAGPVTFLPDGRMQVVLHNRGAVLIPVNISTVGLDGRITLRVPDGTLSLSLTTPAIR